MYKTNDYVKYKGDCSTTDSIRRNEDVAKILFVRKNHPHYWVGLELLTSKENISCSIDKITTIETNLDHLTAIGFQIDDADSNNKLFVLGDVIISSIGLDYITKENMGIIFISGFCIGNLLTLNESNHTAYIEGDIFNVKKFYDDFPSVNNINDLFEFLKEKAKIDINIEEIISY